MIDRKSTICQLLTSNRTEHSYLCDKSICSSKDHLQFYRTIYSDLPKSSQIFQHKQSIFSLKESKKSLERVFRGNSKEYISTTTRTNKETIRHIGLQTDYRDESTQTNPFSPAYFISDVGQPEVFALSDFTYGKGLPATALEISFIERLRARREWEQDHSVDMTRAKLVMEREIREWQMREKEIQMLQTKRHELFTNNLHNYIDTDENLTKNIIELTIYRQEKQLKLKHEKLEIDTRRAIRRVKRLYQLRDTQINRVTNYNHLGIIGMSQCGNSCVLSLKPPWHTRSNDIIETYRDTNSKVSISCSHTEQYIDHTMMNLSEIDEILSKNESIDQTELFIQLKTNKNKKLSRRIRDLEKAFQLIQNEKFEFSSTSEKKPLRFVEKIEPIDSIQQSNAVPIRTEAHDQRRISIIKLQNYLRSLIIQSKISHISEIRHDLLDELKNGLTSSSLNSTDNIQFNRIASPYSQIFDYLESETIGDMLDFLSKELVRLQCEQTIHLFVLAADRIRQKREAAETGTRTKIIEQQKLQEHVFQQIFSLNNDSDIESYLEDFLLQSISNTADEQARIEMKQITKKFVDLTDQITCSSSNSSDIETIVSDLVHNFLIPTVHKVIVKRQNQSDFSFLNK